MENQIWVWCLRHARAGLVALLPLTQVLLVAPARAVPAREGTSHSSQVRLTAQVNPSQDQSGSNALPSYSQSIATPQAPLSSDLLASLSRLTTNANPELPPLKDALAFLPAPDPFAHVRLVIKLSEHRVYVYDRDQVKTSFPIAIGREGWETPTGEWSVIQMFQNPIWQHPFTGQSIPPGPDNPLGSRWIGFWTDGRNFIGFHGTPDTQTVGKSASHGCIRMYDRDVVKLFSMVRIGTPVDVVP